MLLERRNPETLKVILQSITINCADVSTLEKSQRCAGAAMALYFFSAPDQDRTIRQAFRALSPDAVTNIFLREYAFFHNRPKPEEWIGLLDELPILWDSDERKKMVVEYFKDPKPELKRLPWPGPEK
jgi:hypothetical protein